MDNEFDLSATLPFAAVFASAGLMYLLGARVFASSRFGLLTSAVFLLTPLLWYTPQSAPHALYPLPFVAGWLVAAAYLQERDAPWWAPVAAGGLLGLGMYTTNAAAIMMPLYLVLTVALGLAGRSIAPPAILLLVGAFLLAAFPYLVSLVRHPEQFRAVVSAYHLYDAQRFNVLQGLREMTSWVGLTARTEVYYDFFNPAFLFLTGRVLLFPLAVLIPIGLWHLMTSGPSLLARLSLAGFLVAPFAASLTAEAPAPARILFITPFAALVSVYGVRRVWSWPRPG